LKVTGGSLDAGTCKKKVHIKGHGMNRLVAKRARDFDGQHRHVSQYQYPSYERV
jgi:hypothetical protein